MGAGEELKANGRQGPGSPVAHVLCAGVVHPHYDKDMLEV